MRNSLSEARKGAGENPTPLCERGEEIHPVTLKLAESPGVFSKAPSSLDKCQIPPKASNSIHNRVNTEHCTSLKQLKSHSG